MQTYFTVRTAVTIPDVGTLEPGHLLYGTVSDDGHTLSVTTWHPAADNMKIVTFRVAMTYLFRTFRPGFEASLADVQQTLGGDVPVEAPALPAAASEPEAGTRPRDAADVRQEGTAGIKKDAGKPRFDLLPPAALAAAASVFTFGADKYDKDDAGQATSEVYRNNWRQGMRWGRTYAALQRHLSSFWSGEDRDAESGKGHLDHALCCLMMLHEYQRSYPQGDDRATGWRKTVKIGLDIDGTLCNLYPAVLAKAQADLVGPEATGDMAHYAFRPRLIEALWELTEDDYKTMPALMPGAALPFEPVVYVTARNGSHFDAVEHWLAHHGFPYAPVVQAKDKVQACRDAGVDVYVDDHFHYFQQLNAAGITCYLLDAPYNRKHDVGDRRLMSLADLPARLGL